MDSAFTVDEVKMWWKHEEGCLEKDLKPFINDEDASLLALFAENNNCQVEIYTEPKPSTNELTYMKKFKEKQKGNERVKDQSEEY